MEEADEKYMGNGTGEANWREIHRFSSFLWKDTQGEKREAGEENWKVDSSERVKADPDSAESIAVWCK